MITGIVTWFDPERGVGTIAVEGTDRRFAVRSSDIDGGGRQSLSPDTRVRFTPSDGPDGARAVHVWVP